MKSSIKKIIISEFDNSKCLAENAAYIGTVYPNIKTDLYKYYGKYRLILYITENNIINLKILKNTYLEFFKTLEYGNLIIKNAVISLSS